MKKITFLILFAFMALMANANYMLVQNVTTTGNDAVNKTIQVQFDISWENSWRDSINWDAAWIFIKFKDGSGNWQHAKLNTTGYTNGTGTANTVQVTSDNVGAWIYRSTPGAGNFNVTSAQLQWNYGLNGITDVTGLEVRVFAVEMVYVPEGDFVLNGQEFDVSSTEKTNQQEFAVVNTRLSPTLKEASWEYQTSEFRIKGSAGIDTNNDGVIDNTTYPTGHFSFYCYKFLLTSQQIADFYNTLTSEQLKTFINVSLTYLISSEDTIFLKNNEYFSVRPNTTRYCGDLATSLAYADWCGLRPMSIFEYSKAYNGPYVGVSSGTYNRFFVPSTPPRSAYSYYGIDINPYRYHYFINDYFISPNPLYKYYITTSNFNFIPNNGDGVLNPNGSNNVNGWTTNISINNPNSGYLRYVRSAE